MENQLTSNRPAMILGETTVFVTDDEFGNGFQTGYLRFKMDFLGTPLTDAGIYDFLCRNMQDVRNMPSYNTGYVTGWYGALFEKSKQAPQFSQVALEIIR